MCGQLWDTQGRALLCPCKGNTERIKPRYIFLSLSYGQKQIFKALSIPERAVFLALENEVQRASFLAHRAS